jgi:ABC-type uncharacterized transport system ATPase component
MHTSDFVAYHWNQGDTRLLRVCMMDIDVLLGGKRDIMSIIQVYIQSAVHINVTNHQAQIHPHTSRHAILIVLAPR